MNLSEFFIKRPVATTLLLLGILVMGGMAYQLLPISDLPNIDFPTIQVSAGLPGATCTTSSPVGVGVPLQRSPAPRDRDHPAPAATGDRAVWKLSI